MTFGVKLHGELHYDDDATASTAFAAMMDGREENQMLGEGAQLDGTTIRFEYDDFLPVSRAADWVDSTEFGIEKALVTARTGSVVYTDESGFSRTVTALGRQFWYDRWAQEQTAFHSDTPHDLLVAHIEALERGGTGSVSDGKGEAPSALCVDGGGSGRLPLKRLRVLVPLAGKSEDLWWLAARGHEVVGVEFVIGALDAFFGARDIDLWKHNHKLGAVDAFTANGVTMLCADFLALTPEAIGTFDAIFDRAAIVALEPSTRERYVATCRALSKPAARMLVVGLAYEQTRVSGPPWSLPAAEIERLYGPATVLQTRSVSAPPRFTAAGVAAFEETAYLIE